MTKAGDCPVPSQRIDRFLWHARLAPNRPAAQAMAERAVIRLNGRRVERAHVPVRPGDVLTLPQGGRVLVIRIVQLPVRRGPSAEARLLYERIGTDAPISGDFSPPIDIDAGPRGE
jgi:ribosome-associated heat shock protein Hsp15